MMRERGLKGESLLTPRRINEHECLWQGTPHPHRRPPSRLHLLSRRTSPRERMTLTPAFGKNLGNVLGVQVHVHAPVRVVDVANFAISADVDGMARKEGEAVLLETTGRCAEFGRVFGGQTGEGGFEGRKGSCGAVLVELALGGEAGDGGRGAGAVREVLRGEDAGCWTGGGAGGYGGWGEGVSENEEAKPGEAGVAGECGGCTTRSEEEEVVIVVANEK